MTDDTAPGWDAIDAALRALYPGVDPLHYGTLLKWRLGGPDPLDGISIYPRDGHWHYVSYGMSELYGKESDDPEESGWGFEFTFRLTRAAGEAEPPTWAANFLQNLARYVFESGNPFAPGHHVDLNGPISLADPETEIRAVTFADDPELPPIDTPHGRLRFLQIVGLTLDEYAAIERWDSHKMLQALAPHLPLFVTDLTRHSLLAQPGVAQAIEEGVRRDGSSTGALYVEEADWRVEPSEGLTTVSFGANAAGRIARVLEARIPFGQGLFIDAPGGAIAFEPGEKLAITDRGDGLAEIDLPESLLAELTGALRPVAGTYPLPSAPGLVIEIVKSQIRDPDGNVVEEVG